jgi:parallel beta-helix repeat protein
LVSVILCSTAAFGAVIRVPGDQPTIQAGIDAASTGDTVLVANGTYTGAGNIDLDFKGKAITVRSKNGPDYTIIDCEQEGRGFHFHSGEGQDSVVSGFTIENGDPYSPYNGGGILCDSSSPTITNCTISENYASNGGGISCDNSSPTVTNCTFSGNDANYGGGIYCNSSSPTITNCTFSWNDAIAGGGISCRNSSSPTITNCTFSGNWTYVGGGISCRDNSSPTITDCTISGNDAEDGGGISCDNSSPTIINCTITGNAVEYEGGGISCWDNSSPTITGCTISENGVYDFGPGGGIYCDASSPTITACTITGNSALGGGGIFCWDNSSPTITDCTISGNASVEGGDGGGIYLFGSSATITNCTISGNVATYEGDGGGIYLSGSSATITNCTISGNEADFDGGGISCRNSSSVTITNCTISENWTIMGSGGGIYCDSSSPTITDCAIRKNTAYEDGGGIHCDSSSPTITNCIINWNDAEGGAGIYGWNSSPTVTNCTISGNEAVYNGGGIYCSESSPTVTNCILWVNSPDEIYVRSGIITITYSNIEGGWVGTGNIDADPLFVGGGDYHLAALSTCIDAGTNDAPELPGTDFEGDLRITDGDNDGTATVDMGADEYVHFRLEWVKCKITGLGRSGDYTVNGNIAIENLMTEASPKGTLGVYLSQDENFGGDPLIKEKSVPSIKAGKRIRKGFATKAPLPTALRYLYFIAVCEMDGTPSQQAVMMVDGGVDLTGQWISLKKKGPNKRERYKVRGKCSVKNIGYIPAGPFEAQVYYAPFGSLDGTERAILKKPKRIPKLLNGKKKIVRFNYKTDEDPMGTFFLVVDEENGIAELEEGNNVIPDS